MRRLYPAVLFFSLMLVSESLANSLLHKAQDKGVSHSAGPSCDERLEKVSVLNSAGLVGGAGLCDREERWIDVVYLLIAGQIRFAADLAVLKPKDDPAKDAMGRLAQLFFYRFGGAGRDEYYRDPQFTGGLFDRLGKLSLSFGPDYDPGWRYRQPPTASEYDEQFHYHRRRRLAQLRRLARLVSNEAYHAARRESDEISRRNPRGIVAGTADYKRWTELNAIQQRIASQNPVEEVRSPPFRFTPDPDATYKQVLTGFNGPPTRATLFIGSVAELRGSWLSRALNKFQMERLLAGVNFDRQMVVAVSTGLRTTATGRIHITDISFNALQNRLVVRTRVGVTEQDCDVTPANSYPFAVAIADRPSAEIVNRGFSVGNFGDICKAVMVGNPTE